MADLLLGGGDVEGPGGGLEEVLGDGPAVVHPRPLLGHLLAAAQSSMLNIL